MLSTHIYEIPLWDWFCLNSHEVFIGIWRKFGKFRVKRMARRVPRGSAREIERIKEPKSEGEGWCSSSSNFSLNAQIFDAMSRRYLEDFASLIVHITLDVHKVGDICDINSRNLESNNLALALRWQFQSRDFIKNVYCISSHINIQTGFILKIMQKYIAIVAQRIVFLKSVL